MKTDPKIRDYYDFLLYLKKQAVENTEEEMPPFLRAAENAFELYAYKAHHNFGELCGQYGKGRMVEVIEQVNQLIKQTEPQHFFSEREESFKIYEILESVVKLCEEARKDLAGKITNRFEECDKQFEKIDMQDVMRCFVDSLCYVYDQEEEEWNKFRLNRLFRT